MSTVKIFSVFLLITCTSVARTTPVENEVLPEKTDSEAKGILDGATPKAPTTTPATPGFGGLGGLPGLGQGAANASPKLILGSFQAIVMNFDPSMIQGIPGMPSLPMPGKK